MVLQITETANAMNNELETDDGLLLAISELRCVVDQLIDEQIVQLTAVPGEVGRTRGSLAGGESGETFLKTSLSSSAEIEASFGQV
ncbi:MAG TPA: hypothetical protein VGZ22_31545, partial [Isosphaeraceae bacterium]|nr:hypothetical protein [Isosphaeraceae bacterium]